jgi:serine/threonine-protein kinase
MTGQVFLQRYRVIRQLDVGGMSTIFLARQTDLDREVVVKVVKNQLRDQAKVREHFRREILIMSRFEHPNAVSYFDSDLNDRTGPVLVMEYVRGVPLDQLLKREGRWSPERVGRLLAQLCEVLQAAHDAGIVHRDLKPGNLMIVYPGTPTEKLKLMDFGLAKMPNLLYFGEHELVDTRLPLASGTPEYIPPEQARGFDLDPRSDLYSTGVILFELLTGRRPFERDTVDGLLDAHLHDAPPSFAAMGVPGVPPAVEAVVRSCLAKHPEERPASAAELAQRYEEALGRKAASARLNGSRTDLRAGSGPGRSSGVRPIVAVAGASRTAIPTVAGGARAPAPPVSGGGLDAGSFRHSFESFMPDALALIKLKGFMHDLGGEVVESLPGVIRVRVPWLHAHAGSGATKSGLFAWARRAEPAPSSAMEMEVHLERLRPDQPGQMTVTMVLRSPRGIMSAESRNQCQKLGLDLQAYLMGR